MVSFLSCKKPAKYPVITKVKDVNPKNEPTPTKSTSIPKINPTVTP